MSIPSSSQPIFDVPVRLVEAKIAENLFSEDVTNGINENLDLLHAANAQSSFFITMEAKIQRAYEPFWQRLKWWLNNIAICRGRGVMNIHLWLYFRASETWGEEVSDISQRVCFDLACCGHIRHSAIVGCHKMMAALDTQAFQAFLHTIQGRNSCHGVEASVTVLHCGTG